MIRPAKILVINPNTSVAVTERFVAEARLAAPAGVWIDGVTGSFGAAIVSTEAENVIAARSALKLLAAHAKGYDAAILAISFDSALAAAREIAGMPVVGITQSAINAVLRQGNRIGLIIFGSVSRPLYEDLLRRYGVTDVAIETIEIASTAEYLQAPGQAAVVREAAQRLIDQARVDAVVICGAAIVGLARALAPSLSVPVVDGAAPAVDAVLRRLAEGAPARPQPPPRDSVGARCPDPR